MRKKLKAPLVFADNDASGADLDGRSVSLRL
jgi:hypothetical protein